MVGTTPFSTYQAKQRESFRKAAAMVLHQQDQPIVISHEERIKKELLGSGISPWGLLYSESRYLPTIIHNNEHIEAIVYGRTKSGRSMLVATDKRVIFLDKKPMFIKTDEITYSLVGGVSYSQGTMRSTLTLHTRMGDISMHSMNRTCMMRFKEYIELRCVEQQSVPDDGYIRTWDLFDPVNTSGGRL